MALANRGTLFLDEIGDMPIAVQAKLLRALQEREIEQVGSNTVTKLDIRVIAASSQDLQQLVNAGKFRADLYYRLNVLPIYIPALRARLDDMPLLVDALLEDVCKTLHIALKEVDCSAISYLQNRQWAGNIRELRNSLERVCVLSNDPILTGESFREISDEGNVAAPTRQSRLHESMSSMEKEMIIEALEKAGGNKTIAARSLGMSRSNLYLKLAAYGLN